MYVACIDSVGNADTADSAVALSFILDTVVPTQSLWSPSSGGTLDESTVTVALTLSEAGSCMASLENMSYGSMVEALAEEDENTVNCSGDGTTSASCVFDDLGNDGSKTVYVACADEAGNADTADSAVALEYDVDTTAPVLAVITPIATVTDDATPSYTFSSSEVGMITYGGSCTSMVTAAIEGNNTVTFISLENGTYSNCTITVIDGAEHVSEVLAVRSFIVNVVTEPVVQYSSGGSGGYARYVDLTTPIRPWECGDMLVDSRDEQEYTTVKMGDQCWMGENLNVGTMIVGKKTQGTSCEKITKYCYDDKRMNCDIYGGLYQWDQVMCGEAQESEQGICPEGWHVPSHEEFTTLERGVCVSRTCAKDFPFDTFTSDWRGTKEGKYLRDEMFRSLLGGFVYEGKFVFIGIDTSYWVSTASEENAWLRHFRSTKKNIQRGKVNKSYGLSVRCIQDLPDDEMQEEEQNMEEEKPLLIEKIPVPAITNAIMPSYTFSSDKAGTIIYGGKCRSRTVKVREGDNTIVFDTLAEGVYADCTITVVDEAMNLSEPLHVRTFIVQFVQHVDTNIPTPEKPSDTEPVQETKETAKDEADIAKTPEEKNLPDVSLNAAKEKEEETAGVIKLVPEISKVVIQTDAPQVEILLETIIIGNKKNNPEEIRKLEIFLNVFFGEKLPVNGIYEKRDIEAVKRFQKRYASEILTPFGLKFPTGHVGVQTVRKINQLISVD